MRLQLGGHRFGQQSLEVPSRLVAANIWPAQVNKDSADVAVLELNRSVTAPVQLALKISTMRCLAICLPSQLQREHLEMIRNDQFNLFAGPI